MSVLQKRGWPIEKHPGSREARMATAYDDNPTLPFEPDPPHCEEVGAPLQEVIRQDHILSSSAQRSEPSKELGVQELEATVRQYHCL